MFPCMIIYTIIAADYSEISRALPDPPSGYTWVCDLSKREWQVVRVNEMSDGLALPIFSSDNTAENIQKQTSVVYTGVPVSDKPISLNRVGFVRHTVQSSDTFQGLCIKVSQRIFFFKSHDVSYSSLCLKLVFTFVI